jgi:hypothetical protein
MKSLTLGVLLLTAQSVFAQEVTVIPPPPPMGSSPQWMPNPEAQELMQRGRRKKLAGALLMGIGGGVLLTGTALVAWTYSANECGQFANTRNCLNLPAFQAGALAMAVGFGALVVGIPIYVVGNAQVHRAQRMTFSLLPAAGGASLRMQY